MSAPVRKTRSPAFLLELAQLQAQLGLASFDPQIRQDLAEQPRCLTINELERLQRLLVVTLPGDDTTATAEELMQQVDGLRLDLPDRDPFTERRLASTLMAHGVSLTEYPDTPVRIDHSGRIGE